MLKGVAVQDTKPERLSKSVSMVYQNPEDMFIKDSIEADIAYAMQVREVENWKEKTADLLERFRLTELKNKMVDYYLVVRCVEQVSQSEWHLIQKSYC